jgi:hypothetical protein
MTWEVFSREVIFIFLPKQKFISGKRKGSQARRILWTYYRCKTAYNQLKTENGERKCIKCSIEEIYDSKR